MFKPRLFDVLNNYNTAQFSKDLMAGIIVGIVALPLAIAFSIAAGVSPEKGLYTAIIAGFIISFLGGSRVQIGGPTGAFIVIIYSIVQQYGVAGLTIATFMAGIMLVLMGIARLGTVIQYIPYPLIVGFTSGIAVLIFSSQIKDFFGLHMEAVPSDFIPKWKAYVLCMPSLNWNALMMSAITVIIVLLWPRVTHKLPGSLVAILITTVVVHLLKIPVETIGSRFGNIPSSLPAPEIPGIEFATLKKLIQPAFTIAMLGGIESLLSAVVADGMTGERHKSNIELVAQGAANIVTAFFGGIPATGAIARTATNIKNGGRTPVAGIVHSITLLLIMLFAGKWAALIPLPTLAGILVLIAYNMGEWRNFKAILKGPRSDATVLLITFLLTVFIDLTMAIEIGFVLAAFLFMRKMIQTTDVNLITDTSNTTNQNKNFNEYNIPEGVEVFEITGPLFFGATYKFRNAMDLIEKPPKVLILRMGKVPVIDATGIKTLKDFYISFKQQHTKIILSEITNTSTLAILKNTRLLFAIGKSNVTASFEAALLRSENILKELPKQRSDSPG